MKWFKHDSDANSDAKLKRVRMKYGLEGYGLYWYCLELITNDVSDTNLTFELEHDAEVIAFDVGIHQERVQEMMTYMVNVGLFENNNGRLTCLKILKRLDTSMTSNNAMRGLIQKARSEVNQVVSAESHDSVMMNPDKVMQDKTRLEKTKLDKTYVQEVLTDFDTFWQAYPKKRNKEQARKAWNKQKPDLDLILTALIWQTELDEWDKKEGQFIPNPSSYLNAHAWLDEQPAEGMPF
tara:strand:+ start:797 stop:1507 length:711 start_codon:yes stop_codon:yes gene_type:complete